MFGAITTAMRLAASATRAFCSGFIPVVPITMFTPSAAQVCRWRSVPSGRVKSTSACAPGSACLQVAR